MNNSICKPEESNIPPVTSTIISPDGRYTLDNVNDLIDNFQSSIVLLPQETTSLSRLISTYGSEAVYQSIEVVNRMLVGVAAPILPNYPSLNERINTGVPITPVEYAEFVTQFLYTPLTIEIDSVTDYVRVITQLDDFFTSNFSSSSMSSFCALAPSIFGAIQGFFDILDNFRDIINKIRNFSVADLLNQLKQKILDVIDRTIESVKRIIENFTIENIVGRVEAFVNETIISRVVEMRDLALSFFSEENIQNLRNRVEGLINYAISLFRDPSIEEIQYLIYRFCSFISNVENAINEVRNPLNAFTSNYQNALSVVSGRSNGNTANAVAAGAIRYGQDQRIAGIEGARAAETAAGNPLPLQVEEVPGGVPWNDGRGIPGRITFSEGMRNAGREAYERVNPVIRTLISRVQQRFGRELIIVSGYRSPELQRSIWINSAVRRGLASDRAAAATLLDNIVASRARNPLSGSVALPGNSQHNHGQALDVTWSGINIQTREEFIAIAIAAGFNGIGRYGTGFVHVDQGSNATWGS
jgi:uncharacterized protein YcbK (DUF882 family)